MNKIRTPEDVNKFRLALAPIDQAMFASEQYWGVGRLERLQTPEVLAAWQRGWDLYRPALDDGDWRALEELSPKLISSLAFMHQQATEAGHLPLAPDVWEAPMPDGTVLCVVRTSAEASHVLRDANRATATPGAGVHAELPGEGRLPPDLTVAVREQHEGRALRVVTMAEIARLLMMADAKVLGTRWEGAPAYSGVQLEEGAAADIVRKGWPLSEPLAVEQPKKVALDF